MLARMRAAHSITRTNSTADAMHRKNGDALFDVPKCGVQEGNLSRLLRSCAQSSTALWGKSAATFRSCSAMNRRTVSYRYLTLALSFIHSGGCPARLRRRIVATETLRSLATSFSVSRGSIELLGVVTATSPVCQTCSLSGSLVRRTRRTVRRKQGDLQHTRGQSLRALDEKETPAGALPFIR